MQYVFRMNITEQKSSVATNLQEYACGEGVKFYYADFLRQEDKSIEELAKKNKGIGVRETADKLELYCDPYLSVPIYLTNRQGMLVVTSCFEDLMTYDLHIDRVGFYEDLLYESPLHDRTLFEEVKQIPAACKAVIDKATLDYRVESYWNFTIGEDKNIKTEAQAVEVVWENLCSVFSHYADRNILMGISGGLDSRLSMCVMKQLYDMNKVELFTFGHHKSILDYRLAKKVCRQLEVKVPQFFRLPGEAYLDSLDLPVKSGGAVGIAHSHIYWCLGRMKLADQTLISNYYSDGIMGYDCIPIDYEDILENCDYYKRVFDNPWEIEEPIKEEIVKDILKIVERRGSEANFSCYDEYIYLVERNPKFHIRLSYILSEKLPVALPYAEYNMLHTMISLPMEYRYRKRIEQLILEKKFVNMRDVSSKRYGGMEKGKSSVFSKVYYNFGFAVMRGLNLANSVLNGVTGGVVQIPNPYITENQLAIMNRCFTGLKQEALKVLEEYHLITGEQRNAFGGKCLRTAEAQKMFVLIGIAEILKKISTKTASGM